VPFPTGCNTPLIAVSNPGGLVADPLLIVHAAFAGIGPLRHEQTPFAEAQPSPDGEFWLAKVRAFSRVTPSNFERPRAYSKNVTPKYCPKRQSAGILLPAPVSDTETQRCVRNVRHIAAFRARPDSVCVRDRLSAWGGWIRTSASRNQIY
jgi:hypothetical protein